MYKDFKDYKTYITDRQHSVVVKNFKEQTYSIKKLKIDLSVVALLVTWTNLLEDYKRKGKTSRSIK